jgi:hypothetical protein
MGNVMGRQLEDADHWGDEYACDGCAWDRDGNADDSTIPCPYCGREIYEDSPRCPHCGQYISAEDAPPSRPQWWIVAGVALCLGAILVWIMML